MEGETPNPSSLPDDTQLSELTDRAAENVADVQQFSDGIVEAIDQDEKFPEMTADSYNQKKSYTKSDVGNNCQSVMQNQHLQSSDSSSSPPPTGSLAPNFSKATGFDLLWNPSTGGFYLSKVAGSSNSGSEASMSSVNKPAVTPVNDDALNVKETKDPDSGGSDSGSESDTSTVSKPPVPPVNDDVLKVKESNDVLLEKISSLEEVVASLKEELKSATDKNLELKHEKEENKKDVKTYKSATKQDIKAMEEELQEKKEFAKTVDVQMSMLIANKLRYQSKHDAEMHEMDTKMKKNADEISLLKSKHEQKEKIWNGVTEHLRNEIRVQSEKIAEETMNMEALITDKCDQIDLIHKLETELISVKFENAGLGPSFEDVEKITDELKLKMVELEKVVGKMTIVQLV